MNLRLRVSFVFLALLLAGSALSAQSWAGRGRLQGTVTDEADKPIAGAKVTLRQGAGSESGPPPLATDAKGKWSILGLAGGDWFLSVEAAGFVGQDGTIRVNEFGVNPALNMKLRVAVPTRDEKAQGAKAAIEIGNQLSREGKWAEARKQYESVLGLLDASFQPMILRAIAQTFSQEQKYDQAIAKLNEALATAPNDLETLQTLAKTQYDAGQKSAAIETLQKTVATHADDPTTLQLLVSLLVDAGREAEAQTYMAKLPQGAKLDPTSLLNVGIRQYNENQIVEALATFERVVAENPTMPDGFYYRGLAYLASGRIPDAKADFQKVLSLDPKHPKAAECQDFLKSL